MRPIIVAASAAALFFAAPHASAQGVIPGVIGGTVAGMSTGQPNRSCLTGKTRPSAVIAAARASAERNFAQYLRVAGSPPPGDASPYFARRDAQDAGRYPLGIGDARAVDDALARSYAATGSDPPFAADEFVVSGGSKTALGRWLLRDQRSGAVLGYYRVRFGEQHGDWKILSFERFEGAEIVPTVPQYCYEPGDLYGPGHEILPVIEPPVVIPAGPVVHSPFPLKRLRIRAKIQDDPGAPPPPAATP